ncbi:hypothetical protein AVEN_127534-1 [Araneus ventricosus]|uniref:Uncharacterized protein n=1 Tax=Araneus ventricosus TaxID=182803 RepID=A0A4Y2HR41_ARAVE|nr:hypothetical protein AVEN_127534-1 [Araneus ventricosus]
MNAIKISDLRSPETLQNVPKMLLKAFKLTLYLFHPTSHHLTFPPLHQPAGIPNPFLHPFQPSFTSHPVAYKVRAHHPKPPTKCFPPPYLIQFFNEDLDTFGRSGKKFRC